MISHTSLLQFLFLHDLKHFVYFLCMCMFSAYFDTTYYKRVYFCLYLLFNFPRHRVSLFVFSATIAIFPVIPNGHFDAFLFIVVYH